MKFIIVATLIFSQFTPVYVPKNYEKTLAHVLIQFRYCKFINKDAGIEGKFVEAEEEDTRAMFLMSVLLISNKLQTFF